jgi:hypothetical protein
MALEISKFESAAKAFIKVHPIGTVVTADQLLAWASKFKDGFASDLLIDNHAKRLSALRRHLNDGGGSRNHNEDDRFVLAVEDAKTKTHVVMRLADHVSAKADAAFGKSVTGALSPLKGAQKAIEHIKLDELPDETRTALEEQLTELVNWEEPTRKTMSALVEQRIITKLVALGRTEEEAQSLLKALPMVTKMQRLLKYTSA